MKSAGRALVGKEVQQAQELEADKGVLARLRGLFLSCGKVFSGWNAARAGWRKKQAVRDFRKIGTSGAEAAPVPHRQAAGKERRDKEGKENE